MALPEPNATQKALLASLLAKERETLEAFAKLLDEEYAALCSRNVEALEAVLMRKNELADALQNFERHKLKVVQSSTALQNADESTWRTVLQHWLTDPALEPLWQMVRERAELCRNHNQRNGAVLRELEHFTAEALQTILRSDAHLTTYDDAGRNRTFWNVSSRPLGSA